jgi:hypothetical protein
MAGMEPWAGLVPRRARHLIPIGLPRRRELIAVCAVTIVIVHLLVAQLTLVLALVLAGTGKATRWRLWWLLGPAAAGLAWVLAAGPGNAFAGFTAGPSSILRYLTAGHLAGHVGHPVAAFAGVEGWLPRQFPVALIGGAAEAGLIGWVDWLHTDEWAVPPPRPGVVAAARRTVTASAIRARTPVTREGCALGVVPSTGATAELRWAEARHGVLVVGAAAQEVTLAGLQVVHAALRRRKPVIVLDHGDPAVTRALGVACSATGTPLLAAGSSEAAGYAVRVAATASVGASDTEAAGASRLWGRGAEHAHRPGERATGLDLKPGDLGRVVRERTAALLPADSAELASGACTELASLAGELRRIGIDGDALIWVPRGERIPARVLAELLRHGPDAGLSVLIGTTSPEAAMELCGRAGSTLIFRVADPRLAAGLAARTGTRLLPPPSAAALADQRTGSGPPPVPGADAPGHPGIPTSPSAPAFAAPVAAAADLVPSPVIPAQTLLVLGQEDFVLAVGAPRRRLVALGRMVRARLPHPEPRQGTRT